MSTYFTILRGSKSSSLRRKAKLHCSCKKSKATCTTKEVILEFVLYRDYYIRNQGIRQNTSPLGLGILQKEIKLHAYERVAIQNRYYNIPHE
jgi:hypothetical protein